MSAPARFSFVAALVVVVIALCLNVYWFAASPETPANTAGAPPPALKGETPPAPQARPAEPKPEPPPERPKEPVSKPAETPAVEKPNIFAVTLDIAFASEEPLAGSRLWWKVTPLLQARRGPWAGPLSGEVTLDDSHAVQLKFEGWVDFEAGFVDDGLSIVEFAASASPTPRPIRVARASQEVTLRVVRGARLLLSVEYADEVPFEGHVRVETGMASRYFDLRGTPQPTDIGNFPTGDSIRVICFARRVGFEATSYLTFDVKEKQSKLHLRGRIERTRQPQCQVLLDLSAVPKDAKLDVKIVMPNGSNMDSANLQGAAEYRSKLLQPNVEYFVRITGGVAWQSEKFKLAAGEVRCLVVAPHKPASASVRVVDERGQPLSRAILTIDTINYPKWARLKTLTRITSMSGSFALTNENGFAKLDGLPPGERKLLVEGEGFDPVMVEASLAEGALTDLGAITLFKATGTIEIELAGFEPDRRYSVMLTQPGGSPIRDEVLLVRGRATFAELPAREYVVIVLDLDGNAAVSRKVSVSRAHPAARATFNREELK